MPKESILVVDDEEDILELVRYNLSKDGYQVTCVKSGEEALQSTLAQNPALIVLDLMLPGMDGLDVCKAIKSDAKIKHTPIIMLSARGEEADIVSGLELGADDYLVKPFSPRVLSARVKSVLRRNRGKPEDLSKPLAIDGLEINPGRHEVRVDGKLIELTSTEFKILYFLARQTGWVFTRYQIVDAVHGEDYPVTDRSIDVQVVGLRKKLGSYGQLIETVRGVGYRFKG
ncbi:MAG: response regulator transcription factor [Oligoflexia bacterium]|nr:response regulator transcription factor [Oligoflexia bacterium]